ncbi:MAG: exodeoxyribonuclease VII small subunit [Mariprofundales bacterium]
MNQVISSPAIITQDTIDKLDFEQCLQHLQLLVEQLESGELTLDNSVKAFESGVQLTRRCESLLESSEQRLHILEDK